jgi:hypothetical protein
MSQTQRIRRPALKLVPTAAPTEAKHNNCIVHDARGTAVWVGEPSALQDLSSLALAVEPSSARVIEGDPYNRPARGVGSAIAPSSLKTSSAKRRR